MFILFYIILIYYIGGVIFIETKIDIYTQCLIVLYKNGFDNTCIDDILYEFNISKDVFLSNFRGKDEILYLLYENIYKSVISNLNETSTLDISSLDKLNLFIKFLYEFVQKENMSFSIIVETSSRLQYLLNDSDNNSLINYYSELSKKIILLIEDCQANNFIHNINPNIILNMLIFTIKNILNIPFNNAVTLSSLDEVQNFFWNSILVDKLI